MQEEELYHWWQYYGRTGKTVNSQGKQLRVLNCGQLNTACGPDFIAARFELDGIIYQGDVECHCRTSDWYAHNHHLDRAYRHVVLHLVAHSSGYIPVTSHWNRQPIYTLTLPQPSLNPVEPTEECHPSKTFQIHLRSNLIRLALEWFDQKVKFFINELSAQNESSIFYTYFFRALGYPSNANTFQLLAEQLNWAWLMQHRNRLQDSHQVLFAIYAGHAGFIPQISKDKYTTTLKKFYNEYKYLLPGNNFDSELWQFAGNRPCNHAHFRLAAGLQILSHYNYYLYDIIIEQLQMRREYLSALTTINRLFKLPLILYWTEHYALGKRRSGSATRFCLADARIKELLINIILPLAGAQSLISGSEGYFAYIQSLYLNLPLTSVYGVFNKKQVSWYKLCFEIHPCQVTNQSLLMLQSCYCRQSLCEHCPINRVPCVINGKIIDNKIKNI